VSTLRFYLVSLCVPFTILMARMLMGVDAFVCVQTLDSAQSILLIYIPLLFRRMFGDSRSRLMMPASSTMDSTSPVRSNRRSSSIDMVDPGAGSRHGYTGMCARFLVEVIAAVYAMVYVHHACFYKRVAWCDEGS
jgi:hypothetical protein